MKSVSIIEVLLNVHAAMIAYFRMMDTHVKVGTFVSMLTCIHALVYVCCTTIILCVLCVAYIHVYPCLFEYMVFRGVHVNRCIAHCRSHWPVVHSLFRQLQWLNMPTIHPSLQ